MEKSVGKYYSVSFSSGLGARLNDYFASAASAEQAAVDLVLALHGRFGFPVQLDATTEVITPDDAEYGGLAAIVLPKDVYDMQRPDPVVWDSAQDPDDPSSVVVFPRVNIEIHYIRYKRAKELVAKADPRWTFNTDNKGNVQAYMYEDVWRSVLPADKALLINKGYKKPFAKTKLALGTLYAWDIESARQEGVILPPYESEAFGKAVELYKAFSSLPVIPNTTLVRILGLRSHADKPTRAQLVDEAHVSFATDKENGRYLFNTPLKVTSPDMVEVMGVEEYFNQ